jgi:hypothetical protein
VKLLASGQPNKLYTDFEADFEYKLEKGGNSGFYLHAGSLEDFVAAGIEVQLYDSSSTVLRSEHLHERRGGVAA